VERGESSFVKFGNGHTLSYLKKIKFHVDGDLEGESDEILFSSTQKYGFEFVQRTQDACGLTKKTILRIYNGLSELKKSFLKKNPEGFSNIFVKTVKDVFSEHIAENIQFTLIEGSAVSDLDKLFPKEQAYVQAELVDGSENSLYSHIQIDSDVEQRFVKNRLVKDDLEGNIVTYFKFPPRFKISLPKAIGNYNPDWGIIRQIKEGKLVVELVRETKGYEDLSKLQRSSEGHKIRCAEKYFSKIGLNYRHVTDKTSDWMD